MDNRELSFSGVDQLKEDILIDLFEIDSHNSSVGKGFSSLYLVSTEQSGGQTVRYVNSKGQYQNYKPVPIALTGIEISGSNTLPTPKLSVGNVDGGMSDLAHDYDDLIGFRLTRIRTYKKYLHSIGGTFNSPPNGSDTAHFTPEVWYFDRKEQETKLGVIYQLASVFDIEGMQIPKRRAYPNFCTFAYRGPECQYSGPDVPTAGKPDGCSKTLNACMEHFGHQNNLRFGGFPTVQN